MESAAPAAGSAVARSRIGYFLAVLAVALLVGLVYYGVGAFRNSTFNNARAFRVLGEISEQFQNLQISFDGLLRAVPDACVRARHPFAPCEAYAHRLAFNDLTVRPDRGGGSNCDEPNTSSFLIRASTDPKFSFEATGCPTDAQTAVVMQGQLTPILERFISQSFFDEVVIAFADGGVLAEIPRREQAGAATVPLHDSKIRSLAITNASPLLLRASAEIVAKRRPRGKQAAEAYDALDVASGETPPNIRSTMHLHPVAFTESLGGSSYDVFISAVKPAYPSTIGEAGGGSNPIESLYLVGIKRSDVRAQISSALGPGGGFALSVLLAGVLLAFPLLGLVLKSPLDSIRWSELASCVLASLLLCATLGVSIVWVWSYYELRQWADNGAQTYAEDIVEVVESVLRENVTLLHSYEHLKTSSDVLLLQGARPIPITKKHAATYVPAPPFNGAPLRTWSPLRSSVLVSQEGVLTGASFSAYAAPPVRQTDVTDRGYFRALAAGQEWRLPARNGSRSLEFIAQRLFNRGDGARVLQVAIPLKRAGAFAGLVTGDARVHGLTAGMSPLFLRYAIVGENGAVIFHSDDTRSLAENFFIEAEDRGALRDAAHQPEKRLIPGSYGGQRHRFHYASIDEGIPWGVFVFYPTTSLTEMASQTALAAFVAYTSALLFVLIPLCLIAFAIRPKRVKKLLSLLWPRIGGDGANNAYVLVGTMALLLCGAAPAQWIAIRYHDAQLNALIRDHEQKTHADIRRRIRIIANDLQRWEPDAERRKSNLPDPVRLAVDPQAGRVPGFEHQCTGRRCEHWTWRMNAFAAPPYASDARAGAPLNSWMQSIWAQTASSPTQRHRATLASAHTQNSSMDPSMYRRSMTGSPEQLIFLGPALTALVVMVGIAAIFARRVFGAHIEWEKMRRKAGARSGYAPVRLYLNRRGDGNTKLAARCGRNCINLLTDARFEGFQSPRLQSGAHLLTDLDLALIEPRRRRKILDTLEGLIGRDDIELIVTARRSPFAWLYHSELYPSSRAEQAPADAELVRWDAVLSQFTFDWQAGAVPQANHPMAFHHHIWKLCNMHERLVLYHLATGHIANPKDDGVIRELVEEGLVSVNSRPNITDANLIRFVRTAEPTREIARWQHEASRSTWRSVRRPLLVAIFALVALAALWLSWTGGEVFKVASTVLMGAVALLGNLSSAFSFVRSPGGPVKAT